MESQFDRKKADDTSLDSNIHFHSLDALRFFACFKVFLQHIPILIFPLFSLLKAGGQIGVEFFFTLSGFLITLIIIRDKEAGKLHLKHFFIRRILRIWPLYYLMVLVAYVTPVILQHFNITLNNTGYKPSLSISLLFLENYKMIATGLQPNVSPLPVMWSLCVEEHFYIVWGLLLFFIASHRLLYLIIPMLILGPFCRVIYYWQGWLSLDLFTNIDLFAYGALVAFLFLHYRSKLICLVQAIPSILKILFTLVLILLQQWISIQQISDEERINIWSASVLGILFAFLLLLLLPQNGRFRIKDSNIFSKWGTYTYGFYLYHTLVIALTYSFFSMCQISLAKPAYAILYLVLNFIISLLLSRYSYHYFEKPFLKLKKYFR